MLGQVKFSEAISSICPRCRSSSRPMRSAISGSTSASGAARNLVRFCSFTAIEWILDGPWACARPEDDRRIGVQVDDRGGDARELAGIDLGCGGFAQLLRHVGQPAW